MRAIALFPGQSSRDERIFARLAERDRAAAAWALDRCRSFGVFAEVTRPEGSQVTFEGNLEVQLAVFAVTRAYARLATAAGLEVVDSAGLSLGEYSHVVEIGALTEDDALQLVAARGRAYDDGPAGVMAAVQPVEEEALAELVARVATRRGDPEAVAISNVNSPSQCVIAGLEAAVEEVIALAEEELFAVGTIIEAKIPMHCARFAPARRAFDPALAAAPWRAPRADYWPNVLGAPVAGATAPDFISLLGRHVCEAVRWRQTVDGLVARHPGAAVVEVGPRTVVSGLLRRGWHAGARVIATDGPAGGGI